MKIYRVGGCIRDKLLGRPLKDTDYVVVGGTPEMFLRKYPGAKCIGRGFPVYLFEGSEYAFARKERLGCMAPGHRGFEVDYNLSVTLMDDLSRRDLTINAIAQDISTLNLHHDPRALKDLDNKILRHVSSAFKEDPLRVLRVARFQAELSDFTIAPETLQLMKSMRMSLETLSAERVFGEMALALETKHPNRFFEVLKSTGCLKYWFRELYDSIGIPAGHFTKHGLEDVFDHLMDVMCKVPTTQAHLKFAGLCHDLGKTLTPPELHPKHHHHDKLGTVPIRSPNHRLKTPAKYFRASMMFANEHMRMHKIWEMNPGKVVRTLLHLDKCFPGGILSFMACQIGDGEERDNVTKVCRVTKEIKGVKLPSKYRGRGATCAEILLNLQCHKYKHLKSVILR